MANVYEPSWDGEAPAPWSFRAARVGDQGGGVRLGATLYEIAPAGVVSPLHVHHANEEMAVALTGGVTLRTPEGERVLAPGEVVGFPAGPAGAHQLRNRGAEPVRVLVVSEMRSPEVADHLDSGKRVVLTGPMTAGALELESYRRADVVPPMTDEPGG